MTTQTTGVINAPKPKPPAPKSSPKDFKWISPGFATEKDRQAFAASLQELLPTKQWTHANLAEKLWGRDNNTARNIGKARDWVRGTGYFPNEKEAGYTAQLLDVTMQRLLQPKVKFDPSAGGLVRAARPRSEWKTGKPGPKSKANGHDANDSRWTLPDGVDPPTVKMETSKKHPALMVLELKGEMPPDIAMAIMAMASAKRATG